MDHIPIGRIPSEPCPACLSIGLVGGTGLNRRCAFGLCLNHCQDLHRAVPLMKCTITTHASGTPALGPTERGSVWPVLSTPLEDEPAVNAGTVNNPPIPIPSLPPSSFPPPDLALAPTLAPAPTPTPAPLVPTVPASVPASEGMRQAGASRYARSIHPSYVQQLRITQEATDERRRHAELVPIHDQNRAKEITVHWWAFVSALLGFHLTKPRR